MSNVPKAKYNLWQAIATALAVGTKALEEVRSLARLPGPKGDQGDPGPVGMGAKDFDVLHDGERGFTFKWERDGQKVERKFSVPVTIYRDVFQEGKTYQHGDMVSMGGSVWFCPVDETQEKPGAGCKDWKLAVRRGRDGSDAKPIPSPAGPIKLR